MTNIKKLLVPLVFAALAVPSWEALAQPVKLLQTNAVWKYNVTACLDGVNWTAPAPTYDDTAWPSGPGGFTGGETRAEALVGVTTRTLPAPTAAGGRAMYFRTTFTVTSVAQLSLIFSNRIDDDCAFYINGTLVQRIRLTADPIVCLSFGTAAIGPNTDAEVWEVFSLSPAQLAGILVEGQNTLAVEVHQSSSTSSDMVFACDLTGVPLFGPINCASALPADTNLVQNRTLILSSCFDGLPVPTLQWYHNDAPIDSAVNPTATNALLVIAGVQSGNAGTYFCRAIGNATLDSRTATVGVDADGVAPTIVGAVGSADFQTITVQFSEAMDPSGFVDLVDTTIEPDLGGFVGSGFVTNEGTVVVFTTFNQAPENTTYTITFPGTVVDLAGNPLAATTVEFKSWVANPFGGVVFQVYTNLSTTDNSIAQLTNNVNFPYYPAQTYTLSGLNTRGAYPDDSHEGYGGRMRSLFIPTVSGQFRFFLYSDDSSLLYLNPAGPDPAGSVLVAYEPGCCNPFREPPATQTSVPYTLVAGQGYYIEALYKEGTGGDYCQVGARLELGPFPPAPSTLTNLMNSNVGFSAVPTGLVGPPVISQQPANTIVEQPGSATLSVTAGCTPAGPLVYQWQRSDDNGANFADLPSATERLYTLAAPSVALDNNAQFRVIVKSPGGTVTSDAATLTVNPDTTRPTVLSAKGGRATNATVVVAFSELLNQASAETPGNYEVLGPGGLTVQTAALQGSTVTLTLSGPRVAGVNYQLRVKDVVDAAAAPNTVNPNPSTVPLWSIVPVIGINTQPWRYLHQTELGVGPCLDAEAWTSPLYADSAWPTGLGVFYANRSNSVNQPIPNPAALPVVLDGTPVQTVLNLFTNAGNVGQAMTYYFRTGFKLPAETTNDVTLILHNMVDDGAVYYLNGNRIANTRLTTDPVLCANLSTAGGNQTWEPALGAAGTVIPAIGLLAGASVNTLAVEVHQTTADSSDITLGVFLEAEIPVLLPMLHYSLSGVTLTLTWDAAGFSLQEGESVTGPWNTMSATSPKDVTVGLGAKFYQLIKTP